MAREEVSTVLISSLLLLIAITLNVMAIICTSFKKMMFAGACLVLGSLAFATFLLRLLRIVIQTNPPQGLALLAAMSALLFGICQVVVWRKAIPALLPQPTR